MRSFRTRCEVCGLDHFADFIEYADGATYHVPPRKGRRYCSDACRQKAYRERKAQT